ncbi:MAG: phage holin family protein [Burkholderiales bacterium]|nr:phage holin family protein [Burkholderiales bacterium]
MAEPQASPEGLFASLKTLGVTFASILQTRLELLSTDIAEERSRLGSILLLSLVALFCVGVGVGVLLLTLLVVVLFWDTHRLAALGTLTVLFLAAGGWIGGLALQRLRNKPRLFEASIAELAKDREHLGSGR